MHRISIYIQRERRGWLKWKLPPSQVTIPTSIRKPSDHIRSAILLLWRCAGAEKKVFQTVTSFSPLKYE